VESVQNCPKKKERFCYFVNAFDALTLDLAKSVAKDGECATKFVEIEVKTAKTKKDAKLIPSLEQSSSKLKNICVFLLNA
jgi:glutamate N-acetyltransferase/amino-acid N-acetyltransferase